MSVATLNGVHADTHAGLNLRVAGPLYFGDLKRGDVMPKWAAELSGSTAETLVAKGTLEWTHDPVVKSFQVPTARPDIDINAAMSEELDRVRRQNTEVMAANKALAAENAALKVKDGLQTKSLGEQTTEIGRLKVLADGYAIQVNELEEQLEQATTPDLLKKPEPPAKASSAAPKK